MHYLRSLAAGLCLIAHAQAWPAMAELLEVQRRQGPVNPADPPTEEPVNTRMPGDLATIGAVTPVGKTIQNMLLRVETSEAPGLPSPLLPPLLGSSSCKQDTCKKFRQHAQTWAC